MLLLRDRTRSVARSIRAPARARSTAGCHQPANRTPERLHVRPARPALPGPLRSGQQGRRKIRARLHSARLHARLLPFHPRQSSLCERRRLMAPSCSCHLRDCQRPQGPFRRGSCRFSRSPRAGRSNSRSPVAPRPLIRIRNRSCVRSKGTQYSLCMFKS